MTVIAVAAAKSSPGVSTIAELLAQMGKGATRRRILIDCDPAGGEWLLRAGVAHEPGLASLAMAGRRGLASGEVLNHLQRLGDGLEVVVAPAAARQATSALEIVGPLLVEHLRAIAGLDAVVDCGALATQSAVLPLVRSADLVVLVARPTAAAMIHLAPWVAQFTADAAPVVVVVVEHGQRAGGEAAYRPSEVAEALGVEVLGPVANDPAGAARLYVEPGRLGRLARSPLVHSMLPVATGVFERFGFGAGAAPAVLTHTPPPVVASAVGVGGRPAWPWRSPGASDDDTAQR